MFVNRQTKDGENIISEHRMLPGNEFSEEFKAFLRGVIIDSMLADTYCRADGKQPVNFMQNIAAISCNLTQSLVSQATKIRDSITPDELSRRDNEIGGHDGD